MQEVDAHTVDVHTQAGGGARVRGGVCRGKQSTHNDPNNSGIPRGITPTTSDDYQHPYFFNNATPASSSTDPLYLPVCDRNGGCNGIPGANNGREAVHIPCGAKPANGTDGHMVVIDQYTNMSYEFLEVFESANPNLVACRGGTLHVRISGVTSLSGDGRNVCGVAACVSELAGQIRAQEMAAATAANSAIKHALFVVDVGCQRYSVYPAWRENYCNNVGAQWPSIGQFFKLNLTPAQIQAGNYPAWQKTILKTMSRYGMFVGDQGSNSAFELHTESQFTYSSFGKANPWTGFLKSQGTGDSLDFDNLGKQFWLDNLVAIDPCVIQRTC